MIRPCNETERVGRYSICVGVSHDRYQLLPYRGEGFTGGG